MDFFKALLILTLPATEDTTSDFKNFVLTEDEKHVEFTATETVTKGDMIILGPICGIADQNLTTGQVGTMHAKQAIEVSTSELAAGAVFNTIGDEVWFDDTAKTYTDAEASGLYGVGWVTRVADSNNVIHFEKRRYYLDGEDT